MKSQKSGKGSAAGTTASAKHGSDKKSSKTAKRLGAMNKAYSMFMSVASTVMSDEEGGDSEDSDDNDDDEEEEEEEGDDEEEDDEKKGKKKGKGKDKGKDKGKGKGKGKDRGKDSVNEKVKGRRDVQVAIPVDDQERPRPKTFLGILNEKILEAAPSLGGADKEDLAKRGVALPLIILYTLIWFFSLIYLSVTGAIGMTTRVFVNLEGSSSDTECTTVPATTTGVFLADTLGNWETQSGFQYNRSIFALEFKGSMLDNDEYSAMMSRYEKKLKALGTKASKENVASSFIAWSTFQFSDPETHSRFSSTVKPEVLFNSHVWGASISSSRGFCTNNGKTSTFSTKIGGNFVNGRLELQIPLEEDPITNRLKDYGENGPQTSDGICSDQGSILSVWQWDSSKSTDKIFRQSFDIKTTTTIVALNTGLVSKSDLIETEAAYEFDNTTIPTGKFYIDPQRVPMDPLYCLDDSYLFRSGDSTILPACFYPVGTTPLLVYPLVSQVGPCDGSKCSPCNCPDDKDKSDCNNAQTVFAYIYEIFGDSSDPSAGAVKVGIDLQKSISKKGTSAIDDAAFQAINTAINLNINNAGGLVSNEYCPGGEKSTGHGRCRGLCSEDFTTTCSLN